MKFVFSFSHMVATAKSFTVQCGIPIYLIADKKTEQYLKLVLNTDLILKTDKTSRRRNQKCKNANSFLFFGVIPSALCEPYEREVVGQKCKTILQNSLSGSVELKETPKLGHYAYYE